MKVEIPNLDAAVEELFQNGTEVVRVVVEGHTSSLGSDADNLSLSLRRADSVTSFISRELDFPHRDRFLRKLLGAGRGEVEARQDLDDPNDRKVMFRFQFKGTELQAQLQRDSHLLEVSP